MKLLDLFRNAGISDRDIISIFQFRSSSCRGRFNSYTFCALSDPKKILAQIKFKDNGQISKIIPGDLLINKEEQEEFLKDAIDDVNGGHGYKIGYRILYANKPIKGQFQWKEKVRIRPFTNECQIGKGLAWDMNDHDNLAIHLGPPYPIILEVRIKKSPNILIETNRLIEALNFYEWLLTLLVPHFISNPIKTDCRPKWVILTYNDKPEYHLAYEGFKSPDVEIASVDQFSRFDIPEVPKFNGEDESFYNRLWFHDDEIKLPNNIELYLSISDNLDKEIKDNFIRSLYWFYTASGIEYFSIVPFTIAIECLTKSSLEVCPTCNKPLKGPTKSFNEFILKYSSLTGTIDKVKKILYSIRSDNVHGSFAAAVDRVFFSINSIGDEKFIIQELFRNVILNWLKSQ